MSGRVERVAKKLSNRAERLEAEMPVQHEDARLLTIVSGLSEQQLARLDGLQDDELGHWLWVELDHGGRPCAATCTTCRSWARPAFRRGGVVLPPILPPLAAAPAGEASKHV